MVLYANKTAYGLVGYAKEDFLPERPCSLLALVHPADLDMVKSHIRKIVKTGRPDNFTYRIVHKSGGVRWLNGIMNAVNDMNGTPILQAVYSDVTGTQRLLREQKTTYDNIPGGVVKYLVKDKVTLLEANGHYYRLVGTTKETFHSQALDSVVAEDRLPMYSQFLEKASRRAPVDLEFRSRRFDDGRIVWLHLLGRFVEMRDNAKLYQCVVIDITAQKSAQLQLDQERERYRIVMENSADVVYEYDIKTDFMVLYENTGHGRETEVIRHRVESFTSVIAEKYIIYHNDIPLLQRFFSGEAPTTIEVRFRNFRKPESKYVWCQMTGTVIYENEAPSRVVGYIRDVSEFRKIKEEKEELQEIFNQELSRDYENICRIDTDSGNYALFTSGGIPYHNVPPRGDYSEALESLAQQVVCIQDRPAFLRDLQIGAMVRVLDEGAKEGLVYYRSYENDGRLRWKSARFTYFRQDRRTILTCVRDIHGIRMAQQREELRFNMLLREACEKVMEIDVESGKYSLFLAEENTAYPLDDCATYAELLESYARRYVVGEEREDFLRNLSLPVVLEHVRAEGKGYSVDLTVREKDGSLSYKNWNSFLCRYDDKDYVLGYIRDVTGRVLELREKEREAEKNRRIIKDALVAAEQANCAKSDFLSKMSHEIRTPMNAIIGMADILSVSLDNRKKASDCLSKIHASSRFLLSLINDILDMSRIESGKVAIAADVFAMEEFLVGITSIIAPQARDKGLDFTVHAEPLNGRRYKGDALRIKQVLINLLSNALKFTPQGGSVRLDIQETHRVREHAYLLFTVADTGIGIAPHLWEQIFEPFEQAESSIAQRFGGSGLGLSISKNLVSLMNGHISVHSIPQKGSTFCIELPVEQVCGSVPGGRTQEDGSAFKNTGSEEYDFAGQRILLVEDNDLNLEIAQTLLEFKNAAVDTARDGQEAVNRFAASPEGYYALILMDVRMPVKNGLVATREIRALRRADAARIPILAMTANAFAEDMEEARRSGMNEHLSKPIETDKLYARIQYYLEQTETCRGA